MIFEEVLQRLFQQPVEIGLPGLADEAPRQTHEFEGQFGLNEGLAHGVSLTWRIAFENVSAAQSLPCSPHCTSSITMDSVTRAE